MHRLVYTSTSKKMLDERELRLILRAARERNAMDQVTGLLIYHDGCFLQVLEGEEGSIMACYQRISRDSRHTNCILMSNEAVTGRMFSQWWMSYLKMDELSHHQQKQFISLKAFAERARGNDLTQDQKTNAFLLAFMSGFRDLDMAG